MFYSQKEVQQRDIDKATPNRGSERGRFPRPNFPQKKTRWLKLVQTFVIYLVIGVVGLFFYFQFFSPQSGPQQLELSQALQDIKAGKVERVVVEGSQMELYYEEGRVVKSRKETDESLFSLLSQVGVENPAEIVEVEVKESDGWDFWLSLLINLLPIGLMILFFVFISRQGQKAAGSIFSFGKSGAKLFSQDQPQVTFNNAAGVEEAEKELEEMVDFLKNPDKYRQLGARIPKGVLLVGPSGTGKTLLARAVAGEAGVPFYSIAGSEFMEMLVGVGASRVRDLFETAKRHSPSIIFIDEVESIGRHRGMGISGSHGEQQQTLNQILVEMDGFTPTDQVVVIAATNRPDLLDPALTRPGRFDRRVVLRLPDIAGRKGIVKIHMRGKPFAEGVEVDALARRTVGFSGADIENMLNEAAILAAREGKKKIDMADLEEAATKVKLGPERKRLQREEDKRLTAYHEAGHAIVASNLPEIDPVHRVSIVARGLALGFTMIPPQVDRYHMTKTRLMEMIVASLGGRAAEIMACKEMTVGAAEDLEKATKLAYEMVTRYGMSELGPVNWQFKDTADDDWGESFWSRRVEISEELASEIDREVRSIVQEAFSKAQDILRGKRAELDKVAEVLIEKETIEGREFRDLIGKPDEETEPGLES